MKFEVGEKYIVTGNNYEKGNVIEITHVGQNGFNYKTVKGESVLFNFFDKNSLFAKSLEPVKANECIVIYRKDNEVIALDKSTGRKRIAKCSPEDKFDFITGAKLAFERLTTDPLFYPEDEKIKVGDIVTIIDNAKLYKLYDNFFKINNVDYSIAARFAYNKSIENGGKYKVEYIGKHESRDLTLCVIENKHFPNECYLIGIEGVEKC